jgi:hypothetical protein
LILDKVTLSILSATTSMSELVHQGVFQQPILLSDAVAQLWSPLRAVVWIQPTVDNRTLLEAQLQEPKHSEYHIAFMLNEPAAVPSTATIFLESLAAADKFELVRGVSQHVGEYVAVDENLFSLEIGKAPTTPKRITDVTRQLTGVLRSLGVKPTEIRYSHASEVATAVAHKLETDIAASLSWRDADSGSGAAPLLLIVDREDDPFSPLLNQWTYLEMIHEMLSPNSFNTNRVDVTVCSAKVGDQCEVRSGSNTEWCAAEIVEVDAQGVLCVKCRQTDGAEMFETMDPDSQALRHVSFDITSVDLKPSRAASAGESKPRFWDTHARTYWPFLCEVSCVTNHAMACRDLQERFTRSQPFTAIKTH